MVVTRASPNGRNGGPQNVCFWDIPITSFTRNLDGIKMFGGFDEGGRELGAAAVVVPAGRLLHWHNKQAAA